MLELAAEGVHLLLGGEEGEGADAREDSGPAEDARGDLPDWAGAAQQLAAVVHELGHKGGLIVDDPP